MAKAKSNSVKKEVKKGVFVAVGWDVYDNYWAANSGSTASEAIKALGYDGTYIDIHVLEISGLPKKTSNTVATKTVKVTV